MTSGVSVGGWCGLVLRAATLAGTAAFCFGQSMNLTNPLAARGVVVYTPESAQFAGALARLFDPGDIQTLQPLLPFCFFVKNDTGSYLAGLTVLYYLPGIVMPTGKPYRITISMRTDVQIRSRMGSPGMLAFMSPVMQGTLSPDGSRETVPLVDENARGAIADFLTKASTGPINAVVDSIIDEGGFLDGPDEAGVLERVNTKLRAQWDILDAVAGLRGEDLKEALSPSSRVGLTFERPRDEMYNRSRGEYLNRLSRWLDQVGDEALISEIKDSRLYRQLRRRPKQ